MGSASATHPRSAAACPAVARRRRVPSRSAPKGTLGVGLTSVSSSSRNFEISHFTFQIPLPAARSLITALVLLICVIPARADQLLLESFDASVADNSPLGGQPGWHARALFNGVVTDYTTSTPNGNYPTISHNPAGAGSGAPGYVVMGAGNTVSNVFIWRDVSTNLVNRTVTDVVFFTKNNAAGSTERIAIQITNQWYVSAATLNDTSANAAWASNYFGFTTVTGAWRLLNTNTLTLGSVLSNTLPSGSIVGFGVFGQIQNDAGKIRLDEILINGIVPAMPPVPAQPIASPATNVIVGAPVSLSVSVSGTPPFGYKWRKDGVILTNSPVRTGVTSNVLSITATAVADTGSYDVIVTNAFGTNTSPALYVSVTPIHAATVDFSAYDTNNAVAISSPNTNTLLATWTDKSGRQYRVNFNLGLGQPLLHRLEASTNAGNFATIAQDLDCKYRVTIGSRARPAGWLYVFFDTVDVNSPTPVSYLSSWNADNVRVISESTNRVRLEFSDLQLGPFGGKLVCYLYDGSPFLHVQANMLVDQPWVAYIYDALFYGGFTNVSYKDSAGVFQTKVSATLPQTVPGEPAKVVAKHRTIMGTVTNGQGTIAVMSPPHTCVYPTDQSDNQGYLQAGRTFIGTKMTFSADGRYRPWVDAPEGSLQKMDAFLLFNTNTPSNTLSNSLAYTHGDVFKSIPGHYTLAEHFHPEFTTAFRSGGDSLTPFKQTMQSIGLQILQPMEFHGPGHPFNDLTNRLDELNDMFDLFEANSDSNFLIIPGEEYNNFFGGHWSYMFPHRVYFTGWPSQGSRPYASTNFVTNGVTFPRMYQIGDATRMSQLLRDEGGIAWAAHPRTKASRQTPDSYANTAFFLDDSFQAGDWKALPADLSKDRLGFRSFQLMDDTAQWGFRKAMLGEVDTFSLDPTHEIYAHMNVNYLALPAMPPKTNWSTVVDCIRNGDFFTTTGEVLVHSWNATTTGVTATVEWYFPPAFAEISWSDVNGVHKLKQSLLGYREFETNTISIPANLSTANWVRFEAWDIARNGAFTQIHWFNPPVNPPFIAGKIAGFTLINADTDSPVPGYDPIPAGAVLDRIALPANLTIRANSSPLLMDRVTINLDGNEVSRTQWPYTLATVGITAGIGDSPFYDYTASALGLGQHTLTATPWFDTNSGIPLTLSFSVTNSDPVSGGFVMNGLLDGTDYQIAAGAGLYAAIRGNILYVAAPVTDTNDQFILVTDTLTSLAAAPAGKSGLVAFNALTKPWLSQLGTTDLVSWTNGGSNARGPGIVSSGFMEGTLDLSQVFGSTPSTIYLALARYAPGNGGALVPPSQIPPGNTNANIEASEFLAVPVANIRDDNANGVLDVLESTPAFQSALAQAAAGGFVLHWPTIPGRTYEVFATPALPPSFQTLASNLLAGPGVFELGYTDYPPPVLTHRFYRVNRLESSANLLARFPFNGNANDLGPASLVTTPVSVTYTNDSKEGSSAARFDGTNSAVQCNANPVIGSFSASFWLKTSFTQVANPGDQWFNGAGIADAEVGGVATDWGITMTGNAIAFGIGGGSEGANLTITSAAVNDGNWHHIVTTWDQTTRAMKIFVDAQLVASGLSNSDEDRAGAAALDIGNGTTGSRFYKGLLDDLQLYDAALTTNQVNLLYTSPGTTLH